MFRNLTFFRFPEATAAELTADALDNATADQALKPVGPLELCSRGWVHYGPVESPDAPLPWVLSDDVVLLTLGGEDKVLPSSAVNAELAKRLKAIEEREGRKPGGRTRKRIKEDLVHDLLPRALVKPYRLDGYLDLKRGLVVVDTASRKAAEGFVSELRATLGSFPALPVNVEVAPRSVLTGWVSGWGVDEWNQPDSWALGEECQLQDAADHGGVVTIRRMELQGEEVEQHLEAGKQCTRLGLTVGDRLSFTLSEDLVVRKLKFLDGAMDDLASEEREDLAAELDARATLLVGEVGQLFDTLERAFRLSKVEG